MHLRKSDLLITIFYLWNQLLVIISRYNADLLSEAVKRSNMMYGDLNIRESRVIYVHGSVDPWHALGITQTRASNTVAIYIEGKKLF